MGQSVEFQSNGGTTTVTCTFKRKGPAVVNQNGGD
jgi:hypothetical protein